MTLFLLGGFGPAIGAYAAVLATKAQAPLGEYHRRLLRWRVAPGWYLVALALPIALAIAATELAQVFNPRLTAALSFPPWTRFFSLFLLMIVGGGVEELGWRGVAQPELNRTVGPWLASGIIGAIWAVWHLPLFFIPGVSQYGGNFPVFALNVLGSALILGWLYSRTGSILLCVVLHAAANTITSFGFWVPHEFGWLVVLGPTLSVLVGGALLFADPALARDRPSTPGSPQAQDP
jgi:CAAX protease family protein